MRLIILAAGRGQRLYPLTKDTPKSLLDLGDGTTLLDRQLQSAQTSRLIDAVSIVTGYRHELIEQKLAAYSASMVLEPIYNPYFDISNALLSLWCAHYVMLAEDFCVSNGDNIYKNGLLDQVIEAAGEGITLAISRKDHYDNDDMKVLLSDKRLLKISKEISLDAAQADSVGLVIVKGVSARMVFRKTLLEMVKLSENFRAYWQEILNALQQENIAIETVEVPHKAWAEVDFHPDVQAMRAAVLSKVF